MPGGGKRFTDAEKARAVDAFVNGGLSLEAAAELIGCTPYSVRRWAKLAGVDTGAVAANRDTTAEQTSAATAARLAKAAANRAELLDLIRGDITLTSAKLIARRLARAAADEELVELARQRWKDALLVEAQASDFGPEAVKDARVATARAKVDVMVAEASTPDVGDLSLILHRSVRDMLAIEGYEAERAEEDADGRITVVLTAPRPDRTPPVIIQLEPQEADR